jgi:hypothetical protein
MTQPTDPGLLHESLASLPDSLADLLRPELPALTKMIITEVGRCVPEFSPLLRGDAPCWVQDGIELGLRQFVDQIAGSLVPHEQSVKMYRALGRSEYVAGRSLDGLQAAFRVGARVAWRHYSELGERAGLPASTMYMLAEAVFAYVEEGTAHCVGGYGDLRTRTTGDVER